MVKNEEASAPNGSDVKNTGSDRGHAAVKLTVLCIVMYACSYLCRKSFDSNVNEIMAFYGQAKAAVGLIGTCFFVTYAVGQVFHGMMCKYYKPRPVMFIMAAAISALNVIMGVIPKTGFTARMISKFRPACPIISGTTDRKVLNQMGLSWGVIPVMLEEKTSTDELFEHIVAVAEEHGLVQAGDIAVITAGIPLGISGTTNMLKVHLVGDVLVSGTVVNELSTCGPLCVCKTDEEALQKFRRGDILVLPKTTNATMPLIRQASGIVTEMDGVNSHAAIAAMALDKPAIVGAAHATDLLRSGTTVKLDGIRGAIFSVSAPSAEK